MNSNYHFSSSKSILFAVITTGCKFISQNGFGSSLDMIHIIGEIKILPPLWIFNLLSLVIAFMIGLACGGIIDFTIRKINVGAKEITAYRGGLFFVTSFFLSLMWYPIFFSSQKIFLSLIISVLCTVCALITTIEWSKVSPSVSTFIMALYTIFNLYVLFINFSVFLNL